jgi:hypothetical protein
MLSDGILLRLANPDVLAAALAPAGAPPPSRLSMVIGAVHDLAHTRLHTVDRVTVRDVALQRPLFPIRRDRGTWTGVVPSHSRTDLAVDRTITADPVWIDIIATVELRTIVEVDPGAVESVTMKQIEGFTTLEEFRARFRSIDLDAFMAAHSITTVDELRDAHHYLLTEIRLRAPPAFDPTSPANVREIVVPLALLVRDQIDLVATLRDAKLVRALATDVVCTRPVSDVGEVIAPYAVAVVFPHSALPGGLTAATVDGLFAREDILSLFVDVA